MLIVSDDFPGISKAIETLFPYTDHQLCLVHLQRNVKSQMDKEDSQVFNKELKNIKENSLDYEDGLEKLDDLCDRFKSKYPNFIETVPKLFLKLKLITKNQKIECLHEKNRNVI
jgi:transposase-like protein